MLEEAAPLTERRTVAGWLGEWLLSVWGYFGEALGTFRGRAVTVHAVTALVGTVLVARPGAGARILKG